MLPKPFIGLCCCIFVILLGVLVVYGAIRAHLDTRVNDSLEMCSTDAPTFDFFHKPPLQTLDLWMYNLTNPFDYATLGATAKLNEIGPFGYDYTIGREDVEFHGRSEVEFTLLNMIENNVDKNCKGCDLDTLHKITTINPGYITMLGQLTSEGRMFLTASCGKKQVANMAVPGTFPYCTAAQIGNTSFPNCKCCYPNKHNNSALNAGAVNCAGLLQKTSAVSGVFSWMSMYDGGLHLDNTNIPNFPLAQGIYTPLVRTVSVKEIIAGSPSALVGYFQTGNALTSVPVDTATLNKIKATTRDVKDICYHPALELCPRTDELSMQIKANPANKLAILKAAACSGLVPDYETLISVGFSESRALELRYLEGVSCRPFSPAVVFSAMVNTTAGATASCLDAADKLPCCMRTFQLPGGKPGAGMGCLQYADGVLTKRKVYDGAESAKYLNSRTVLKTACQSGEEKLKAIVWFNQSVYKEWFTPNSYVYGVTPMPWADATVPAKAALQPSSGHMSILNVSNGRHVTQVKGTGPGKAFLRHQVSNGHPKDQDFKFFSPATFRIRDAQYRGNGDFNGLQTIIYDEAPRSQVRTEQTQRAGELPYPNMVNMLYSNGRAGILGKPNFADVDPNIYQQVNNADKKYPTGSGVEIYRTHECYEKECDEIEPNLFGTADRDEFQDVFKSFWEYEPATGLTIQNQVSFGLSMFTWNCNPLLDYFCYAAQTPNDLNCYDEKISGTNYSYSCSNANIYTPKVVGAKVFPIYWNRVRAAPPKDTIDEIVQILRVRYVFSVFVIVICAVSFIFLLITIYLLIFGEKSEVAANKDGGNRGSEMASRAPPDSKDIVAVD